MVKHEQENVPQTFDERRAALNESFAKSPLPPAHRFVPLPLQREAPSLANVIDYFAMFGFAEKDAMEFYFIQDSYKWGALSNESYSWSVRARLWLANKYPNDAIVKLNEAVRERERAIVKKYLAGEIQREDVRIDFVPMP